MIAIEVTLWVSLAIVLYAYLGFPVVTALRALLVRRPVRSEAVTPDVSIIVCCHNEAAVIAAKLESLLAVDYPHEHLEILVASDGSTDATNEIVCQYTSDRLHLLVLPRGGKAAALNAAALQATGHVLVFTDANGMWDRNTLRELVAPLADERVGGVAGNQVYRKSYDESGDAGEQTYWSLDRQMKAWQSQSGSVTSATGALYAIRRELFEPAIDGVTDDFFVSTSVVAHGRRLVFAPRAVCYEPVAGKATAEFGRKTRIITRGLRSVLARRALLNPFRTGFYSLQLFSHKVVRRLVALPLLGMAILSPMLWNEGDIYKVLTVGQALFYAAGLVGLITTMRGRKPHKLCAIPFYFCLINAAVLVAMANIVRGKQITVWNPHRGSDEALPPSPKSSDEQDGESAQQTASTPSATSFEGLQETTLSGRV